MRQLLLLLALFWAIPWASGQSLLAVDLADTRCSHGETVTTSGYAQPGLGAAVYVCVEQTLDARPFSVEGFDFIAPNGATWLAQGDVDVHLCGAIGDGRHDDTSAFQLCNDAAEVLHKTLYVSATPENYKITSTVDLSVRALVCENSHVGGGGPGLNIRYLPRSDPSDDTDLAPAFRIYSGMTDGGLVENCTVTGPTNYRNEAEVLAAIADVSRLGRIACYEGDPRYDAFAPGWAGFEVGPSQQVLWIGVRTDKLKAGIVVNANHQTFERVAFSGLFGVYFADNSGGIYFNDSSVDGAFAGFLLGDGTNSSPNRYGGNGGWANALLVRTHTHSSPFGILQVSDSPNTSQTSGLSGRFTFWSPEKVGHAAIALLPRANSNFYGEDIGLAWAPGQVSLSFINNRCGELGQSPRPYAFIFGRAGTLSIEGAGNRTVYPYNGEHGHAASLGALYVNATREEVTLNAEGLRSRQSLFSGELLPAVVYKDGSVIDPPPPDDPPTDPPTDPPVPDPPPADSVLASSGRWNLLDTEHCQNARRDEADCIERFNADVEFYCGRWNRDCELAGEPAPDPEPDPPTPGDGTCEGSGESARRCDRSYSLDPVTFCNDYPNDGRCGIIVDPPDCESDPSLCPPPPDGEEVGMVAFSDAPGSTYNGHPIGYFVVNGTGTNTPPAEYTAYVDAAEEEVRQARERGRVGVVSWSMSNWTREWCANQGWIPAQCDDHTLVPLATADPERHLNIVFANCARGGKSTIEWGANDSLWRTCRDDVLPDLGLGADDVLVTHHKFGMKRAPDRPSLPTNGAMNGDADAMYAVDRFVAALAHQRAVFPNVVITYISPRIYGGYANPSSNSPEPYAYEYAFSAQYVIRAQLRERTTGVCDPLTGCIADYPTLAWGPYLWGPGSSGPAVGYRTGDLPTGPDFYTNSTLFPQGRLQWTDGTHFGNDKIHPATEGERQVIRLMLPWYQARSWYQR